MARRKETEETGETDDCGCREVSACLVIVSITIEMSSEGWCLRKVGTTLLTFRTKKLNVTSLPATQSKV